MAETGPLSATVRGTAQRNDAPFGNTAYLITDPESRVVDHFSRAGSEAMIDSFSGLLDFETRALLRRAGGSIFEDSLELDTCSGLDAGVPAAIPRAPRLLAHAVSRDDRNTIRPPARSPRPSPASRSPATTRRSPSACDATSTRRSTTSTWATTSRRSSVGELARADVPRAALRRADRARAGGGQVDVPESESLACGLCDDWRALSSGAELAGRDIVSDEMLPGGFGGSYRVATRRSRARPTRVLDGREPDGLPRLPVRPLARVGGRRDRRCGPLARLSRLRTVHPRAVRAAPSRVDDGLDYAATTPYPGGAASGHRRTDVAVYNQALTTSARPHSRTPACPPRATLRLRDAGLTARPRASGDADLHRPARPSRRLVVADQESMPLGPAPRLLDYARAGLPVVVAGDHPDAHARLHPRIRTPRSARRSPRLLAQPSVRRVANAAAVPAALAAAGVAPDAVPSDACDPHDPPRRGRYGLLLRVQLLRAAVNATLTLSGDGAPTRSTHGRATPSASRSTPAASASRSRSARPEPKLFVSLAGRRRSMWSAPAAASRAATLELRSPRTAATRPALSNGRTRGTRATASRRRSRAERGTWRSTIGSRGTGPRATPATSPGTSTTSRLSRGQRSRRSATRPASAATHDRSRRARVPRRLP